MAAHRAAPASASSSSISSSTSSPTLEPVEAALNILIAAALAGVGAAVAAKFTPSSSVRRQREEAAAAWDAAAAGAPTPVSAAPVGQDQEQGQEPSDPVFTAAQLDELKRLLATPQDPADAVTDEVPAEQDEASEPSAPVQRLDREALEQLRRKLI